MPDHDAVAPRQATVAVRATRKRRTDVVDNARMSLRGISAVLSRAFTPGRFGRRMARFPPRTCGSAHAEAPAHRTLEVAAPVAGADPGRVDADGQRSAQPPGPARGPVGAQVARAAAGAARAEAAAGTHVPAAASDPPGDGDLDAAHAPA